MRANTPARDIAMLSFKVAVTSTRVTAADVIATTSVMRGEGR